VQSSLFGQVPTCAIRGSRLTVLGKFSLLYVANTQDGFVLLLIYLEQPLALQSSFVDVSQYLAFPNPLCAAMEALGAVAACVQLAEIATRTLLLISKLYRKARDAPEYVQRVDRQLSQLIALVTLLQPCFDLPAYVSASNDISAVLEDCHDQADQLARVIDGLLSKQNEPAWKRGWHAVKCLKRQEKITSISNHLERHKSTLSLWVAVANQYVLRLNHPKHLC
jgi:hypothetical protein